MHPARVDGSSGFAFCPIAIVAGIPAVRNANCGVGVRCGSLWLFADGLQALKVDLRKQ